MNFKKRLLLFFILAQALDGGLTYYGVSKGIFEEINFITTWLVASFGLGVGLLIAKSGSILLGFWISPAKLGRTLLTGVTVAIWLLVVYQIAGIIYHLTWP